MKKVLGTLRIKSTSIEETFKLRSENAALKAKLLLVEDAIQCSLRLLEGHMDPRQDLELALSQIRNNSEPTHLT